MQPVITRKCFFCGKYFASQVWDGNYVCPDCRTYLNIDTDIKEDSRCDNDHGLCMVAQGG